MGNKVHQLSQKLDSLLPFIILDSIFLHLNQIHCVISRLSTFLNETLTLACNCKRETIFCRLFFTSNEPTIFHNLYHLSNLCIPHMNWLFIIYDQDFGTALGEIFLLLPQILSNDPSISSAWSCMVIESKIWELEPVLITESTNLDLRCISAIVEELLRMINESEDPALQVLVIKLIGSLAEICHERRNHDVISALVSQLENEHQSRMDWCLIMRYLAMNVDYSEAIWNKPGYLGLCKLE